VAGLVEKREESMNLAAKIARNPDGSGNAATRRHDGELRAQQGVAIALDGSSSGTAVLRDLECNCGTVYKGAEGGGEASAVRLAVDVELEEGQDECDDSSSAVLREQRQEMREEEWEEWGKQRLRGGNLREEGCQHAEGAPGGVKGGGSGVVVVEEQRQAELEHFGTSASVHERLQGGVVGGAGEGFIDGTLDEREGGLTASSGGRPREPLDAGGRHAAERGHGNKRGRQRG
jgi:hypothetical protein